MNIAASETFISTMVDRIVEAFLPAQIVLFGSHARGTATERSDVDLLVILPKVSDKRDTAIEIRRVLGDLPVCKDLERQTPIAAVLRLRAGSWPPQRIGGATSPRSPRRHAGWPR